MLSYLFPFPPPPPHLVFHTEHILSLIFSLSCVSEWQSCDLVEFNGSKCSLSMQSIPLLQRTNSGKGGQLEASFHKIPNFSKVH